MRIGDPCVSPDDYPGRSRGEPESSPIIAADDDDFVRRRHWPRERATPSAPGPDYRFPDGRGPPGLARGPLRSRASAGTWARAGERTEPGRCGETAWPANHGWPTGDKAE